LKELKTAKEYCKGNLCLGDFMEMSSADFTKLTLQEVADLLLERLNESENDEVGALLKGTDNDGNIYNLKLVMSYDKSD
jgi:hypothetical protein